MLRKMGKHLWFYQIHNEYISPPNMISTIWHGKVEHGICRLFRSIVKTTQLLVATCQTGNQKVVKVTNFPTGPVASITIPIL